MNMYLIPEQVRDLHVENNGRNYKTEKHRFEQKQERTTHS